MHILRIEHAVPDYDRWKATFDSDPAGRQQSGVRSYSILRPVDDPRYVLIDLEFDTLSEAEAMLGSLRGLWGRVEGTIITGPQAKVVEIVESRNY